MAPFTGVIVNQKEHFPIGSPFAYPIPAEAAVSPSQQTTIQITSGATFHLSTATIADATFAGNATLFLQTRDHVGLLSLCHFSAKHKSGSILSYTGLGIAMTGPCTIELSTTPYTSRINVFGSVTSSSDNSSLLSSVSIPMMQIPSPSTSKKTNDSEDTTTKNKAIEKQKDVKSNKRKKSSDNDAENTDTFNSEKKKKDSEETDAVVEDDEHEKKKKRLKKEEKDKTEAAAETATTNDAADEKGEETEEKQQKEEKAGTNAKKDTTEIDRNDNKETTTTTETKSEEPQIVKLSKRQRRKLAKLKAKQLAETIDANQGREQHKDDDNKKEEEEEKKKKKKPLSITRERRLNGGLIIRDIILGDGLPVKSGRKVSILYEGAFTDGKVFDRNQNKHNPLVFRPGTGAVIRGLERGIEGMKVGGERVVTIPPKLGYGSKGSGKVIPPGSTLVFTVQLLDVGGK